MTTVLYELIKYIETASKNDDCTEEVYKKVMEFSQKLHNDIKELKNKVEILANEPRLDMIELLLKEGLSDLEDSQVESPYIVLGLSQLQKLRNPFD